MQAHEISIHVIMMVLQGLCFQRNDSVMKYINMIYQLMHICNRSLKPWNQLLAHPTILPKLESHLCIWRKTGRHGPQLALDKHKGRLPLSLFLKDRAEELVLGNALPDIISEMALSYWPSYISAGMGDTD